MNESIDFACVSLAIECAQSECHISIIDLSLIIPDLNMEPTENDLQEYLNAVGERRIDEDIQNKLREILKCGVCYEVPVEKELKIHTCEQGHHFCTGCFKKLKHCGICRGQFFLGRNFAVEEIITQLGTSFGLTKSEAPAPEQPSKLISGVYSCLHQCSNKIRALHMLQHIRTTHPDNLFDNVRSNPYLKIFNCTFEISFVLEKIFVSSFQISDMGLFTVVININSTHLIGSAHMLSNPPDLTDFQYKLTVKINKSGYSNEFSVSDCDLFDYNYQKDFVFESERGLKINLSNLRKLISEGDNFQILFSVWRKTAIPKKKNNNYTQMTILPDDTVLFNSDRRQRRNKQRNMRKKRNRQSLRENKITDDFLTKFRNLAIIL